MKKHNFYAGPAILPEVVKQQTSEAILDFEGMGLSVMEISHRSAPWEAAMEQSKLLVRELLGVSDEYEILFLSGGASSQFFMTAMNLLDENETAGYIDTGTWSAKAIKEAGLFGKVNIIASSKADNYAYLPKAYTVPSDLKYLHITTNNTVYGTQFHSLPDTPVPLVGDMSSDIFSKPIDVNRYDIIYSGAQKNMGPSGVTLVIVKKDALGKVSRKIPSMLDYQVHIKGESMFNTPPVLPIYVSMLTMEWVKACGGVAAMEIKNKAKAELLYNAIDQNDLFDGLVNKEDRSVMNPVFKLVDNTCENEFLKLADDAGIVGIEGHRSVGGFRASMYNAMEIESVQVLVDVMNEFSKKHG